MKSLCQFRPCVVTLFLLALLQMGCNRNFDQIEIDPRFSYNVSVVPHSFPKMPNLLPLDKQGILNQHGPPDFMHFFWEPNGEFITSSDLSGKFAADINEAFETMKITWVYTDFREENITDRDFEIEFPSVGPPRFYPISRKLKFICRYGDPKFEQTRYNTAGVKLETWKWLEHGMLIEFEGDEIKKRTTFPATGRGTIIK